MGPETEVKDTDLSRSPGSGKFAVRLPSRLSFPAVHTVRNHSADLLEASHPESSPDTWSAMHPRAKDGDSNVGTKSASLVRPSLNQIRKGEEDGSRGKRRRERVRGGKEKKGERRGRGKKGGKDEGRET